MTDLASAPITNGSAVPVKPNIMLLMDTSDSMGWTQLRDELEVKAANFPIGYRANQCNRLYYNPTQTYVLPKRSDGSSFPAPSFAAAPYDGFDAKSRLVDLSAEFQAFDLDTRLNRNGVDPPQPSYYYTHSSGQMFDPSAAPCTDDDDGVSKQAAKSSNDVTGSWIRVVVSDTSGPGMTDERQNFAIWYSYYRTRINLAKSAISLAFTPLNDSYRVGFLTVLPTANDSGVGPVHKNYYLPISDFNAAQRSDWFDKLFSQKPRGTSPTREALSRVGRHYAGQTDEINKGMPEDPVQYSCQKNYTIVTTDGTWNTNKETVGPVQLDGKTRVGQQDGTLTPPSGNSPRPIWDGEVDNTQITTDKRNTYSFADCAGDWFNRSTSQVLQSTSQVLRRTEQLQQSTTQNVASSRQIVRSTEQLLRSTAQTTRSTSQWNRSIVQQLRSTSQVLETRQQTTRSTLQRLQGTQQNLQSSSQVARTTSQTRQTQTQRMQRVFKRVSSSVQNVRSTAQTVRSTTQRSRSTVQTLRTTRQDLLTRQQITRTTSQTMQSTSQNLQATSQIRATSSQVVQSTTQALATTTQNLQQTSQSLRTTSRVDRTLTQWRRSTSQIFSCPIATESCTPVETCTPSAAIRCDPYNTGPTLVASCTPGGPTAGNFFTTTTCAPSVTGPTPVETCVLAGATASNNFTATTCTPVTSGPTPVQTCTASGPTAGNNWTTTSCSTNNTDPTPVQSCTPSTGTASNNWITTTCPTNSSAPTAVASCTSTAATALNNWTATSCSTNSPAPTAVQTCTPTSPAAGNNWTTTTCANPPTTNYTNRPVQTCTPQTGNAGNNWQTITCSPVNTGPTPVQNCVSQTALAANDWTTITCSTNSPPAVPVASCTQSAATAPNWVTTSCSSTVIGPSGVASCTDATASAGNNWTSTTCGNNNVTNQAVQTCANQTGSSANGWATITCSQIVTGPTAVQTCVPVAESSANNWIETTCATTESAPVFVETCTPVAAASTNNWTETKCVTTTSPGVGVQTCTPSTGTAANNWLDVNCSTNVVSSEPVQTCTTASASSANGWTATTCSNPPATNFANRNVETCINQSANAGNAWIRLVCQEVDVQPAAPVAPATCAIASLPTFDPVTGHLTLCYDVTTSVPAETCTPQTPSATNGWIRITCPAPLITGPTPIDICAPGPGTAANSWTSTTCTNPPATNFTNRPVAACAPQVAAITNNWITITCPQPITTVATPVATCTPVAGTSPNFVNTVCTELTTPAIVVDPATCPLGPGRTAQTIPGAAPNWNATICAPLESTSPAESCNPAPPSATNNWAIVTCPSPAVTTNVPVALCSPAQATLQNQWTSTTCTTQTLVPATAVETCAAVAPTAGNNFAETICTQTLTGPIGVETCTQSTGTAANNWVTTTCDNATTVNVPAPSCVPSAANASNAWTTTTCPPPIVTPPTPVPACDPQTPAAANGFIRVTCDTSGPNNFTNLPVASCVPQTAEASNNFVEVTCASPTTTAPVAACTPIAPSAANAYTSTSCNVVTTGPTGVAPNSCVAQSANSQNNYQATTCELKEAGPTPVGACLAATPSPSNGFATTTCSELISDPVLTRACVAESANAGNNFTSVRCVAVPGNKKIQYTTTTTTTSTTFSGGQSVGKSVVVDPGTAADLNGACYVLGVDALPSLADIPGPGQLWTDTRGVEIAIPPTPPAPCIAWPCTTNTSAKSGGTADTLADIAQYYYVTDLRPNMPDNVPPTGTGPEDDRATWQHMTTFTIGLGVSGVLQFDPDYRRLKPTGDFADIREGKKNWPTPIDNTLTTIDDFWHAAVNGRGLYLSAGSPEEVQRGVSAMLSRVNEAPGAGGAVAPSSTSPKSENELTYSSTYKVPAWSGDLTASGTVLSSTGAPTNTFWSAQQKLEAKVSGACDNRRIWLFRRGAPKNMTPFTWDTRGCDASGSPTGVASTGLNADEQSFFDASRVSLLSQYTSMTDGSAGTVNQRSRALGANLLNFIRGQRGMEAFEPNQTARLYRKREAALADIVNSQPKFVAGATATFIDAGYEEFMAESAKRTPMVYVGSNGGMLHAFRAGADASDTTGGIEEWAFVPTQVLPNLYKLADANYANNHTYFVDGSPAAFDAYDKVAGKWRKLLVGGLRAGGRGYYALDVTDPLNPTALWEFNWSNACYDGTTATSGADCHLGFTFGIPTYAKLSDGTWVVLVSSGYNNVNSPAKTGDGQGYLYVLNAFSGRIIHKLSTAYGTAASPSGLGPLAVYTDNPALDVTALQVYGADLAGNVWRFDINDRIAPAGRDTTLVAVAKAPDGSRQPITTALNLLEQDGDAYIVVATGRLLGASDLTDAQRQSVYVFADKLTNPIEDLRAVLPQQVQTQVGPTGGSETSRTIKCSASSICGNAKGWYTDLPSSGERVVIDPKVQSGTLSFVTSIPLAEACKVSGTGALISVDVLSGSAIPGSGGVISKGLLPALPAGLTIVLLPNGSLAGIVTDAAGGTNVLPVPTASRGPQGRRVTWRELVQ